MLQEFEAAGITFIVVSGDMIEGSTMVRLFERRDPEAVTARRNAGDGLPSHGGVRRRHRPRHQRAPPRPVTRSTSAARTTCPSREGSDHEHDGNRRIRRIRRTRRRRTVRNTACRRYPVRAALVSGSAARDDVAMPPSKRVLVLGSGFAGLWAALGAARRLDELGAAQGAVDITVISSQPYHDIRVRNYEADLEPMPNPVAGAARSGRHRPYHRRRDRNRRFGGDRDHGSTAQPTAMTASCSQWAAQWPSRTFPGWPSTARCRYLRRRDEAAGAYSRPAGATDPAARPLLSSARALPASKPLVSCRRCWPTRWAAPG